MAKTSKGRGKKKPKTRKQKVGRFFGVVAIVLVVCLVGGAAALGIGYSRTKIPDPNADFTTNTTFVYFDDGKTELSTLAVQNRQSISYDQMPASIRQAVVAAENRTFWTDPGISVPGMLRAALNIVRGGSLQGGSTITQQYIKIFYLDSNQTVTRKIHEVFLAAKLGRTVPKEDVLRDYLNTIYFGHGAYGIQAASQAYFAEDAKKLTVPQAAVLASVINNPSLFDPSDEANLPRLRDRYRYVLEGMQAAGNITATQETSYAKALPKFPTVKTPERYGGSNGFLLKAVENELDSIGMDQSQVNGGGYKIITTFDKKSQDAAVEAAQKYTKVAAGNADKKTSTLHAAIASVDVGSGGVRAMYGGPDYITNSRNWATTPRPAASTFKVYGLAAGLENGFSLRDYFNGNTFESEGAPIRNEDSTQYGRVSLLRATADSINTAFTDLVRQLPDGPKKVMKEATDAGAPKASGADGWRDIDRVVIGDAEESPLNQATAYATYANGGEHVATHVIKEIQDRNGKTIYQAKPEENRAVSKDVAADITYALSRVVREGAGQSGQRLRPPGRRQDRHPGRRGRDPLLLVRRLHPAGRDRGDVRGRGHPGRDHLHGHLDRSAEAGPHRDGRLRLRQQPLRLRRDLLDRHLDQHRLASAVGRREPRRSSQRHPRRHPRGARRLGRRQSQRPLLRDHDLRLRARAASAARPPAPAA